MASMKIVVAPDGNATLTTIDLVQDLWCDYITYRKQVVIAQKRNESLKSKQHLRAEVFAFLCFITALANRWCVKLVGKTDSAKDELASSMTDRSLTEECAFIAKQAGVSDVPVDNLAAAGSIVADLANLGPDNEMRVFESLSTSKLFNDQDSILSWYHSIELKLGLSRFDDVVKLGRDFASELGEITHEQAYCGYAEIRKDPIAWEKELQERREWEGFGPVVGNQEDS